MNGHYEYHDNKHGVDFPYDEVDGLPTKDQLRDEMVAKVQRVMRHTAEWILAYQPSEKGDRNRVVSSKALAALVVICGEGYLLSTNCHANVSRASKICGLSEANFRRYIQSFKRFLSKKIKQESK